VSSSEDLKKSTRFEIGKLDEHPRERVGHLPTPLEQMPQLASHLSAGNLFIKRDDCTGVAFGGNKVRQLEFHFGLAKAKGADSVLITGAIQSNYVRITAAIAAKLGMQCHVQLEHRVPGAGRLYQTNGNVLLDRIFGAHISYYEEGEDESGADQKLRNIADKLRQQGRSPYIVHLAPGHMPVSALGYVDAAREIVIQCQEASIDLDEIIVASGSGETHAGLLYGLRALNHRTRVTGICVRRTAEHQIARIIRKCSDLCKLTGQEIEIPDSDIHLHDGFLAPGYGLLNEAAGEALKLGARLEGLVLDPTYTAKSFAGFIDRAQQAGREKSLLFVHTGGTPAIFAYQTELDAMLRSGTGA